MLNRRDLIRLSAAGAASLALPRIAYARAATERRLVFLIQRGAADGLATLAPLGDPAYAGLRGDLAADLANGRKLDGLFTLHPALAQLGAMHQAGQALFVHAVATPYRDRSHFDAQNVLETGASQPYQRGDGWMNRLLALLPQDSARALAVSATIPTALRGPVEVASYAPSALPQASRDYLDRVGMLYGSDPQLHSLWDQALQTRAMVADDPASGGRGGTAAGALIASLMTGAKGARVVMAETTGWDTHAGQKARLANQLGGLDALLAALRDGLGTAWADTMVVIATEFGRTAKANGTGGTDHGTGSLAMLAGGSVAGGRVLGDWPGLAPAQLYEGRDLTPTTALDAVIGGAVAGQFGLDSARVAQQLFPGGSARMVEGLVRA